MWKLFGWLGGLLAALLLLGGCSLFQQGNVKATGGHSKARHVVGIGMVTDTYFYLGDLNSETTTDWEGDAEFKNTGPEGGDPAAPTDPG